MTTDTILKDHKVTVTDIRRKVLDLIIDHDYPLSHQDLSSQLPENIDRVTLYRTLHTFEDAGLVHKVIDEEGVSRFAMCRDCTQHEHKDHHAHFHCIKCGKIYCLDNPAVQNFKLPPGFLLESISVDLKGYCDQCNG
jgi:Fur family ferric uptake transcriptional regulator